MTTGSSAPTCAGCWSAIAATTDVHLARFLATCHAFGAASWWASGELIADARRCQRRDLLEIVDAVTAGADDQARSLGCRRCEGIAVGGLRLERAKKLWRVAAV